MKTTKGISKRLPLFIAATVGGGLLLRAAAKRIPKAMGRMMPKMMEGMMGEGCNPMDM